MRHEADHRLANSLQMLAITLKSECRNLTDVSEARAALMDAALRVAAMADLHRDLTRTHPHCRVDVVNFLEPVCRKIGRSIGVAVEIRAHDVMVPAGIASRIGIIVTELAMNAAKHGAEDGQRAILTFEATSREPDILQITLYDNGSGLPDGFDISRMNGLGTRIVASIVERLGGTFDLVARENAKFWIEVPLT